MEKLPNFNRINSNFESALKDVFVLIDMKNLISLPTVKITLDIYKNNLLHAAIYLMSVCPCFVAMRREEKPTRCH